MEPKWPNFLILGAPKCGTRSMYTYLRQHPDIFMPEVKEPHFFAFHNEQLTLPIDDINSPEYQACKDFYEDIASGAIKDIESYTALFNGATNEKAIGEASTTSLYHPPAPINIKRYVPNAKMIAILRDPVDRLFSAYMDAIRRGHEHRSLHDALSQEPIDSDHIWWGTGGFSYIRPSFYSKQLKRYFDNFEREQIKVYLYEDFKKDPMVLIKDIFRFLEVDESFNPNMNEIENISGIPINGFFDSFIDFSHNIYDKAKHIGFIKDIKELVWKGIPNSWKRDVTIARRNSRIIDHFKKDAKSSNSDWETYYGGKFIKPKMPDDIREYLKNMYRDDVLILQEMLNRDLSIWLSD